MENLYVGDLQSYMLDQLVGKSLDITGFAGTDLTLKNADGEDVLGVNRVVGTVNNVESVTQRWQKGQMEIVIEFVSGLKLSGLHLGNPSSSQITVNNANPYGLDFYGINDDGTASTGDFNIIDNFSVDSPFTVAVGESIEGIYIFDRGGSGDDTFNTPITASATTDELTTAGGQVVFNETNYGNEFVFNVVVPSGVSAGDYDIQFEFSGGGTTKTADTFTVTVPA